jgi:hypothetical protein
VLRRRRRIKAPVIDPATGKPVSGWAFVGLILMASSFFLYGASALVAPWWAVVVLMVLWATQLLLCLSWFERRPTWLPAVGLVSIVVWFLALVGGAALLGWDN